MKIQEAYAEKVRSIEQNKRMWSMLTAISEQIEHEGRQTPETWKDLLTVAYRQEVVIPTLDYKSLLVRGSRTSEMGTSEMANFQTFIEAFMAERGVQW